MICPSCNTDQDVSKFKLVHNRKKTKFYRVKDCNKCRHKKRFLKDREWRKSYRDEPQNKLKQKKYHPLWRLKNKDKVRILGLKYSTRRTCKVKEISEVYSERDFKITKLLFSNLCFKCKTGKSLTLDHHYPLSKGYPLSIENAVILCKSCNSSKSVKLPYEFYTKDELNSVEYILALANIY